MTERDFRKIVKYDDDPFIGKIVFREYKKLKELASLKNNKKYELHEVAETNEPGFLDTKKIEELVLAEKKTYEGTFIKFYQTEFLLSLSAYSLKIFVYITKIICINDNKVTLDIPTVSLRCNFDEPRKIYDGLNDLITRNILARHRNDNEYYVNVGYIFRGANRRILLEKEN